MNKNSKNTILWALAAVFIISAVAVAVWLIAGNGQSTPTGVIEQTYTTPPTLINPSEVIDILESTTVAPTETTTTKEEGYVEQFLQEANTYSQTVETTTLPAGEKPFFHVVTDGTVSDSNSLEGLEGAAKTVGDIILAAGFRYDKKQQIFYSEEQSWQRNFGFMPLYDAGAAFVGMYYDTMRLKFNYDNRDWMIQIWKGRYGITTGGEMGVYYKSPEMEENIYACVPDEEMITMSFALYKGDELYMTRGPEMHWWLTGFKLFDMIAPGELTMHCSFFMDNVGMADALEESMKDLGFVKDVNYQRLGLTMTIIWN